MGAAATGALSGAASGAAIGSVVPGIGTAVGAIGGGLIGGLSGLLGGGSDQSTFTPPPKPQTGVLGNSFYNTPTVTQSQDQQKLAQQRAQALQIYTNMANTLPWMQGLDPASKQAYIQQSMAKWDQENAGATIASQPGVNVDMSKQGQQSALFGTQGASYLNTAPSSYVSNLSSDQMAQGTQLGQSGANAAGTLAGFAGVGNAAQNAQGQQYQQTLLNNMLDPARAAIASGQASAMQGAAERGFGYDPLAARDAANQQAMAGQQAGQQLGMAKLNMLGQIPGLAQQGQQALFNPTLTQNSIGQQQASIGSNQAATSLSGFNAASGAALGAQGLDMNYATSQMNPSASVGMNNANNAQKSTAGIISGIGALGGMASQFGSNGSGSAASAPEASTSSGGPSLGVNTNLGFSSQSYSGNYKPSLLASLGSK